MKFNRADALKVLTLLGIFIIAFTIGYQILKPERRLPVFNPHDLDARLVAEELRGKGINHKVSAFSLVNQYGDTVTEDSVEGKIHIVDFFFTTCPGICKDMAVQKRRLQDEYLHNEEIILISHTVTPEIDSVKVMKEYSDLQGAVKGKWHLLTGDKPQIYKLARESYFAIFDEGGQGDESDFIHTENFILIDPQKRIRGYYDGTSEEDVNRLMEDIEVLKKEL